MGGGSGVGWRGGEAKRQEHGEKNNISNTTFSLGDRFKGGQAKRGFH